MQTQTSNTLHNAIMEAGGKDRPPMLAPGNYVQWKSKIKRYTDTKPNHKLIRYCLKSPPYKFTWADKEVLISEGSSVTTTSTHGLIWSHAGSKSKDETPEVRIDFLRLVQRGLHAQVRIVRTDKGTEFLNHTLHAYFVSEGILHQTSVARTPKQNGVIERQNRTLVKAARTMLSAAKVPLFFWAEAEWKLNV
nr:putative ribonuclease H-like domain-containing protein [Tanacetum cinerariifolium]